MALRGLFYTNMFIAHKNDIPIGTAKALDYFNKHKMVSRTEDKFHLLTNVCPHQNIIINANNQSDELVCPYHGRRWDLTGKPKDINCTSIHSQPPHPIYEQCGLLFDTPIDFESTFLFSDKYELVTSYNQSVKAHSNIIMDVFLDVDHIPHAHKDVYEQIGLTEKLTVDWVFKDWGSIQLAVDKQKVCAVWIAQYPGTMVEWQPGALFITQCIPHTEVVQVYQYREKGSTQDAFDINQNIWNTAWRQDVDLAEHIVKRLPQTGERAKDHFREWEKQWN